MTNFPVSLNFTLIREYTAIGYFQLLIRDDISRRQIGLPDIPYFTGAPVFQP